MLTVSSFLFLSSEIMAENKILSEKVAKEAKHRNRLSIHNEELMWKLKMNVERHNKTVEVFKLSQQDNSIYQRSDEDLHQYSSEDVTVSPPTSPKIKGLVETSDAISYILEMDDESPDQVASRAIRRMGSFRSSPTNALKRSKSSSQSPMQNPLSQSASATSIMRQFSAETSPMKSTRASVGGYDGSSSAAAAAAPGRTRSKSMSVKSTVDRSRRVTTLAPMKGSGNSKAELDTSFQTPIHSSSPYKYENGGSVEVNSEKKRATMKNLSFTRCRAASFGAGGGGGGSKAIPTMAKEVLPQESAGEAMILHISDGDDMLSQNSSLTASTSSHSSSADDEETTAEKERTAISIHQQGQSQGQEMVFTSLHQSNNSAGSGGCKSNGSRSGINLISNCSAEEEQQQKWSPTRLMGDVAMEEEEEEGDDEDNVFGDQSESVV